MPLPGVDVQLLNEFEQGLNPRFPERGKIPARVLGYGEISTVFELGTGPERALAYKRLPMFRSEEEARSYQALYGTYVAALRDRMDKVFAFNQAHPGELEAGLDGQISNWAIVGWNPEAPALGQEIELVYFDTSSPLLRVNGVEQLDPELFLRSAPSFLVWLLRLLFLEDVMTRYYDMRQVAIDLIANFYKEQQAELIPGLIDTVNRFLVADARLQTLAPLTVAEVRAYYREDAWIWRLYLAFKKVDRTLHRLLGRDYPYILPEKVVR